jgi:hypothetical protein
MGRELACACISQLLSRHRCARACRKIYILNGLALNSLMNAFAFSLCLLAAPLPARCSRPCQVYWAQSARDGACSLQHLYAMIFAVADDDAPLAVDQNAKGIELPICTAFAADASHVAAVAVAQHLHSMIATVNYDDVACTVKRDAGGTVELPSA